MMFAHGKSWDVIYLYQATDDGKSVVVSVRKPVER
jgi:hypothetical protein